MLFGCSVDVKGIMYVKKEQVGTYIDREKPTGKETLVQQDYQKILSQVPDGDRILGGFCSQPDMQEDLKRLEELTNLCQKKLRQYTEDGNNNGRIYVGLLGGTIGGGLALIGAGIIGVAVPSTAEAMGWVVLGFGVATLALSLANSIGGFNYKYRENKRQAVRLDNMMWTMRLRLGVQVCNASSAERARIRLRNISHMMEMTCNTNFQDDGIYRPSK
jgi:hypothetical protein